jgi:hypothetical protein
VEDMDFSLKVASRKKNERDDEELSMKLDTNSVASSIKSSPPDSVATPLKELMSDLRDKNQNATGNSSL